MPELEPEDEGHAAGQVCDTDSRQSAVDVFVTAVT